MFDTLSFPRFFVKRSKIDTQPAMMGDGGLNAGGSRYGLSEQAAHDLIMLAASLFQAATSGNLGGES